jgi:hypothetical protein
MSSSICSKSACSSGVYWAARGSPFELIAALAWCRLRSRTSASTSDASVCGTSQCGHASSAGHSSGPPIELSSGDGAPGRGCNRVAVRAGGASCGKTAATSTGRGGVARKAFMAAMPPEASDNSSSLFAADYLPVEHAENLQRWE